MKKIKMFGKMIPVFVLVLLGIGMVSAVVVNYLSNQVVANITVESPIELKIGTVYGELGNGPINFGNIVGGETIEFYVSTENKASVPITGTMWNIVSNPLGVTCDDFVSLTAASTIGNSATEGWYSFAPIGCVQGTDGYSVRLITTPTEIWQWSANHYDVAHVIATFKTNAVGTYTLTTYVKP